MGPGAQLSGAQLSDAQFSVNPPEAVQLLLLRVLERQCSAATIGVLWSQCSTAGHHHPRHMGAALTAQPFSRSNTAYRAHGGGDDQIHHCDDQRFRGTKVLGLRIPRQVWENPQIVG